MRCPSCGEELPLQEARFCPHCGAAVEAGEGDATRELSVDTATPSRSDTKKLPSAQPLEAKGVAEEVARDFSRSVRRAAIAGGWKDLAIAAAFAALVASAAGSLLVLAAKLHLPSLGEGADVLSIFSGIVMAGLGVLGAQLHIGDVTLTTLPLGALGFVLWSLVWAVARYVRGIDVEGPRASALEGAKVAVPLALICWLAALIFRIRTDPDPVFIGAFSAMFSGALWGVIGGALGGLLASASPGARLSEALATMERASRAVYEGLVLGGLMLLLMGTATMAATLLWVIVGLLGAKEMVGKEVIAAGIYLVAFLPNVVAAVATMAVGASVEVGAQVTAAGELVGRVQDVSLFSWKGSSTTPWPLFSLLLIPLVTTVLGGFAARRRTKVRRQVLLVIGVGASLFALAIAELTALADARLGAGFVHNRGIGVVAPRGWMVLLLCLAWAFFGALVGWKIAEAQPPRDRR